MSAADPDATPAAAATRACLVALHGPDAGRRLPLEAGESLVGRDPACRVVVPLEGVSRRHCRVHLRRGRASLEDLGSVNGTFLNDRELGARDEVVLRSGDEVRLGGAIYRYLDGDDLDARASAAAARAAVVDALTGLPNRRAFTEALERELVLPDRPLALLLIDVDGFRDVNEVHGWEAADGVLRDLARVVGGVAPAGALLARYGGDELALLLPDCDAAEARGRGEAVRARVEASPFVFEDAAIPVTVSVGVATLDADPPTPLPEPSRFVRGFVRDADERLYEAKRRGRNRVV